MPNLEETINNYDQMNYWLDQMLIANKTENRNLFSEALNKYKLLSEKQLREKRGGVEPIPQTETKQSYTFEPDQFVKCVDNVSRSKHRPDLKTDLEIGSVYKVVYMSKCKICNSDLVILASSKKNTTERHCGCGNVTYENSYYADRFVPCELKVTHSHFSMFTPLRDIERPKNKHCMSVVR